MSKHKKAADKRCDFERCAWTKNCAARIHDELLGAFVFDKALVRWMNTTDIWRAYSMNLRPSLIKRDMNKYSALSLTRVSPTSLITPTFVGPSNSWINRWKESISLTGSYSVSLIPFDYWFNSSNLKPASLFFNRSQAHSLYSLLTDNKRKQQIQFWTDETKFQYIYIYIYELKHVLFY